jgi:DUF971 family protein
MRRKALRVFCVFRGFGASALPFLQSRMDSAAAYTYQSSVRLADIQQIGSELALRWEDGSESFIALEKLRRACPCAECKGEMDVMGNVYRAPEKPLTPRSFELVRIGPVGGYAIQPQWADGHSTGLYSFDYLRALGNS